MGTGSFMTSITLGRSHSVRSWVQMRKLRLEKLKPLAQSHGTKERRSWNPESPKVHVMYICMHLMGSPQSGLRVSFSALSVLQTQLPTHSPQHTATGVSSSPLFPASTPGLNGLPSYSLTTCGETWGKGVPPHYSRSSLGPRTSSQYRGLCPPLLGGSGP